MQAIVLGAAAGGGHPQWNCGAPCCSRLRGGDPAVQPRTQSSLAVSADGASWVLLNASPDLRLQLERTPALHPRRRGLHAPIEAVVLTNGDVDHVAGLLTLRERHPFTLFAAEAVLATLASNGIFDVLDPARVRRAPLALERWMEPAPGLRLRPFAVPGKVPLYREGREEGGEGHTIGLEIAAGQEAPLVYVPGCAAITAPLLARVAGAAALLFDGSFFSDDEMARTGIGTKSARRMGHVPIEGPEGSLALLARPQVRRRIFVHVNHTNPILDPASPERRLVEAAGWEVARDGMEIHT